MILAFMQALLHVYNIQLGDVNIIVYTKSVNYELVRYFV